MNIQEYFTMWWDNRNESPFIFYDIIALVILIIGLSVWIVRRFLVKARIKRQLLLEKQKLETEAKELFESQQKAKPITEIKKSKSEIVLISDDGQRVLVRGHKFSALKIGEVWKVDDIEFDDLMDNFHELKDPILINKYSLESRIFESEQKEKQVLKQNGLEPIKAKSKEQKTPKPIKEIIPKETKPDTIEEKTIGHPKHRVTNNPYLSKEEVEVKIIQSVPDPGKSEPKRIGYTPTDKFKQPEPYNYPVVKMPNRNSLIKFSRKGRSDKRGYKEDDFKIYLDKYFKSEFNVYNNRHIPTVNGRPYEPDFVLENEKGNKNIFINVEIDEPYDGWTRTPTHCIDDDNLRDDFFTKRGWIVIRFTEEQIQKEPTNCCTYIAKVIQAIDSSYTSEIILGKTPTVQSQWDSLQAKKWAALKYRETYLQITDFGQRPKIFYEYKITETEADKAAEKEAPKPKVFPEPNPTNGYLSEVNIIPRDSRISFDPVEHRYFIDGNPDTISVTQLVGKFFPDFDSPYWSRIKAIERLQAIGSPLTEENIIAIQSIILKEWDDKRIEAAKKGTALHEAIESYYNQTEHDSNSTEFQYFLSFKQRYNTMQPFRSEWRIFDEDLLIAGTVDMVFKKADGSLYMFDWKRSEKVIYPDGSLQNDTYQFAFGQLSHLGDNSYNRYCLQQNIYKAILEKRYKQKISSMNLLVLHESYDRYHHIQIPDMQNEVSHIFTTYKL